METIIEVKNLVKNYGDKQILKNISFCINKGEIISIIGESGAGKSTLMRCLNGLEGVNSGSISFYNTDITKLKEKEKNSIKKQMAYVFQDLNIIDNMYVIENVLIPFLNRKNFIQVLINQFSKQEYERALYCLEKVEDLKGKKVAFVDPSSTSGYIFPAVILMDHGINIEQDITYQFAGGHDKALQLLINGDVDAIGTYESAITKFAKEFPEVTEKVKVLQKSDLIPGITLVVSSKVDDATKQKIKDAFLKVTATKEGQELTLQLFGIKGFEEANIDNYKLIEDKLNKMGIDIEKIK